MLGLTNHIKVIIIRTAAGATPGCCENSQELYDPAMPRKVINVMSYCGAPSTQFFAFDRSNLIDQLDLQCELLPGDEIICLWKPLYVLNPNYWIDGLNPYIIPDKRV